MRDPKRIDKFCDTLKEYWKQVPDLRFFQIIGNYQRSTCKGDLFYLEDKDALAGLTTYLKEQIKFYSEGDETNG